MLIKEAPDRVSFQRIDEISWDRTGIERSTYRHVKIKKHLRVEINTVIQGKERSNEKYVLPFPYNRTEVINIFQTSTKSAIQKYELYNIQPVSILD